MVRDRPSKVAQCSLGRPDPAILAQQSVRTIGTVTCVTRRGFFLQTPGVEWDGKASDAIFVYSPNWKAIRGAVLEVAGQVIDYLAHDTAKPVTQIRMGEAQ